MISQLLRQSQTKGPQTRNKAVERCRSARYEQLWAKSHEHFCVSGKDFDSAIMPNVM